MYILQLFDNYAATYSLLVIGLVESLALSWVYGEFYPGIVARGGKPSATSNFLTQPLYLLSNLTWFYEYLRHAKAKPLHRNMGLYGFGYKTGFVLEVGINAYICFLAERHMDRLLVDYEMHTLRCMQENVTVKSLHSTPCQLGLRFCD